MKQLNVMAFRKLKRDASMTSRGAGAVYRHEYKYLCTSIQSAILKSRVNALLKKDIHSGDTGGYRVRSLYFDSLDSNCYFENEAGVDRRDKYRIRIYDCNTKYILLEKKSKERTMTSKTSCQIDETICRKLINREPITITSTMSDVEKKLLSELQYKGMRPVVIVDYFRYPFVEKNGNVRVTFDENISSSNDVLNFLDRDIISRPVLSTGKSVIEVKWDELIPEYIKKHIQLEDLQWCSFSKYYLCRKYNTYGGIRI